MPLENMIEEIDAIRQLVVAYECLHDLMYEDAAKGAFEALKAQVGTMAQCLADISDKAATEKEVSA